MESPLNGNPDPAFPLVKLLASRKPATKAERTFQDLVARIARMREDLKLWQAYELRYNKRIVDEIEPLRAQLHGHQRQLLALFDRFLSNPSDGRRLARGERTKLSQLLMELVTGLLEDGEDEALEALHDKYSEVSRDEMQRSELERAKSVLSDVFGIEIDDDHPASTTDELLEHAQRTLEERAAADSDGIDTARSARRANEADTTSAAQARREQAAKEVSQSLREIYRKLASALHPDREQDADARKQKTAMMQRVNQAYDANDLLALLGLQLEIEQIDAEHLSSVTPKRLAHYNKVLREQLAELQSELARHVEPFRYRMGSMARATFTPADVDRHLSSSVAHLRAAVRETREDVAAFRNPAVLRNMLKHYEPQRDVGDSSDVEEDLLERFAEFAPEGRGKGRRGR